MSTRVLHILDHSWPVLDGYSNRSREIVKAQRNLGWEPTVVTGPLHILDDVAATDLQLDSVNYLRTYLNASWRETAIRQRWPGLRELSVIHLLQRKVDALCSDQKFEVIHAHSPALCGLAGLRVAKARKIPFVYEVRSFWEDGTGRSSRSLRYRSTRVLETHVAKGADALVAIAKPMLADLASRGVKENQLFHVPNGVDTSRFAPRTTDEDLKRSLGLNGAPILGFIGTLFPWEGVPWLIQAARVLREKGVQFKLIVMGDGDDAPELRAAIASTGPQPNVLYLGRIAHDQIERYYSIVDVLVYPRLSSRITEYVTPLKPLEAMALGKPVLASAVGGMRELIDDGATGRLFKAGDIQDFCNKAAQLLADRDLCSRLGRTARDRVSEQGSWSTIARRYCRVYERACENAGARSVGRQ